MRGYRYIALLSFCVLLTATINAHAELKTVYGKIHIDAKTQEAFLLKTLPTKQQKYIRLLHGTFQVPFIIFHHMDVMVQGEAILTYSISDISATAGLKVDRLVKLSPFEGQKASSEKDLRTAHQRIAIEKDVIQTFEKDIVEQARLLSESEKRVNQAILMGYVDDVLLLLATAGTLKYLQKLPKSIAVFNELIDFMADYKILMAPILGLSYRLFQYGRTVVQHGDEIMEQWSNTPKEEKKEHEEEINSDIENRMVQVLFPLVQKLNSVMTTKQYLEFRNMLSMPTDTTFLEFVEQLIKITFWMGDILIQEQQRKINEAPWTKYNLSSWLKMTFNFFHEGGRMGYQTDYYSDLSEITLQRIFLKTLLMKLFQLRITIYEALLPTPKVIESTVHELEIEVSNQWLEAFENSPSLWE